MIPYTTIPLVSAFFLVFVGVLIGHFIWYRYRDEQESLADDLRRKLKELSASLNIQTGEFTEANQRIVDLNAELEVAREQNNDLAESLRQRESLYESVAADLEKSESINLELRSALEQQAELRIAAESENLGTKQHAESLEATLDHQRLEAKTAVTEQQQWAERAGEAEASLVIQQQQMEGLIQINHEQAQRILECEAVIEQLQTSDTHTADLQRKIVAIKDECDQWRQKSQDVETEKSTLQARLMDDHRRLSEEFVQLQDENQLLKSANEEYAAELNTQLQVSQDLSTKITGALQDLHCLQTQAQETDALREDRDRLIQELDERQEEISRLRTEIVPSQNEQSVQDELERARVEQDGLQEQLLDFQNKKADLEGEIREHIRRRESLERSLAVANEEIAQLQIDRERLEGVEDEVVELDSKYRSVLSDLKQAQVEREQALLAESSTREIATELRNELSDRLDSIGGLEQQKDEAIAELESRLTQQEQLVSDLETIRERYQRLEKDHAALQDQRVQQAQELAGVNEELGQLQAYYEQARAQVRLYQQRLSDLEDCLAEQQEAGNLRGKTLGQAMKSKSAFSFRQVQRREDVVRADEKTKLRSDELLGKLYTSPPLRCDDLTVIRGVDNGLGEQLNDLGIYTFGQIMEWDRANIAEFCKRLGAEQIVEQDWVGQARRLYHRQHRAAA